jgi:hypothetical protein
MLSLNQAIKIQSFKLKLFMFDSSGKGLIKKEKKKKRLWFWWHPYQV